MGGLKGRLNALIEARAQGERAESTSGRSGSLPPFRLSSEAELSAAERHLVPRENRLDLELDRNEQDQPRSISPGRRPRTRGSRVSADDPSIKSETRV